VLISRATILPNKLTTIRISVKSMRSLHNYSPLNANGYSARNTVKPVSFLCLAPEATRVFITGDFNDWDTTAHPMRQMPDGAWRTEIPLNHGHHHYLFIVDGKRTLDPRAQGVARNEHNEKVSLLAVS
jgi:1,4-alpha-glucan branching enzyme